MLKATFSFLGRDIELNTNSKILFNFLTEEYRFFIIEGKRDKPAKIEMFVDPPYSERVGKFSRGFFLHIQSLLRNDYGMFHGAAVAKDGKVKVFLGPSESGKTTISLFAGQRGYKLLSDEICLVNKKKLTIASFQKGLTRINSYTIRLFKEHGLHLGSKIRTKPQERIYSNENKELGIKALAQMGIVFAEKEYPIDKIYLFRKDKTAFLRTLPSLCYNENYRSYREPSELMEDLKFLHYLLDRYPYQSIPPFNLSTVEQRRLTYERIMRLLEST